MIGNVKIFLSFFYFLSFPHLSLNHLSALFIYINLKLLHYFLNILLYIYLYFFLTTSFLLQVFFSSRIHVLLSLVYTVEHR